MSRTRVCHRRVDEWTSGRGHRACRHAHIEDQLLEEDTPRRPRLPNCQKCVSSMATATDLYILLVPPCGDMHLSFAHLGQVPVEHMDCSDTGNVAATTVICTSNVTRLPCRQTHKNTTAFYFHKRSGGMIWSKVSCAVISSNMLHAARYKLSFCVSSGSITVRMWCSSFIVTKNPDRFPILSASCRRKHRFRQPRKRI